MFSETVAKIQVLNPDVLVQTKLAPLRGGLHQNVPEHGPDPIVGFNRPHPVTGTPEGSVSSFPFPPQLGQFPLFLQQHLPHALRFATQLSATRLLTGNRGRIRG